MKSHLFTIHSQSQIDLVCVQLELHSRIALYLKWLCHINIVDIFVNRCFRNHPDSARIRFVRWLDSRSVDVGGLPSNVRNTARRRAITISYTSTTISSKLKGRRLARKRKQKTDVVDPNTTARLVNRQTRFDGVWSGDKFVGSGFLLFYRGNVWQKDEEGSSDFSGRGTIFMLVGHWCRRTRKCRACRFWHYERVASAIWRIV